MDSMPAFAHVQKCLHLFLTGLSIIHHQNKIQPSDPKHLHKSGRSGQEVSVHTDAHTNFNRAGRQLLAGIYCPEAATLVQAQVKALYLHRVSASM